MSELDEQIRNRQVKLAALEEAGREVFPRRFEHDAEPSSIAARHGEATAEELEEAAISLRMPGRVTSVRSHGKTTFLDLSDGAGKVQVMARVKALSEDALLVLENLDLGDYLGASGTLGRTRTGELTVFADNLEILSKAMRPLPEKFHGLTDVEARYRQRYLDLATNPESRATFEARAKLVRALRRFLDDHGFLEVETPMMQPLAGGATARPFVTHHNALDLELYLRVAPELYLKRLLVGGLHRVYEINRNFRNEGISTHHNPEFTMLEFYWAYADYQDLMRFTEEMLIAAAEAVAGGLKLSWQGGEIDLTPPWPRLTMRNAAAKYGDIDPERLEDAESVAAELESRGIEKPPGGTYGHLLAALFEAVAEPHLLGPVFITEHPVEISPLSKQRPDDPRFTERFELYLGCMEVANAFSELNDPRVQAERFQQQLAARDQGDDEAHRFDADYIRALEHGMPPAGGLGLGIDRMTMLLTDRASIRDVILFPLLKPRES